MERERGREGEKRIVTLFLYTRKAQNRRRIHRVVAVYPVTNGTEFRFANFVSIYDVEKYLEKFSRYRFERRSKETYIIIIIIIRAIHNKRFSQTRSLSHYPFLSRCPFKREIGFQRGRGYPTRLLLPPLSANEKLSQEVKEKRINPRECRGTK